MTTKLNKEQLEDQLKRVRNELERLKHHVREGGWAFLFVVGCVAMIVLGWVYRKDGTNLDECFVAFGLLLLPFMLIGFFYHFIRAFLRSKEKTLFDWRDEEEEILKQVQNKP